MEPSPSSLRCPICREQIGADPVYCTTCLTPHHRACWEYGGGCAVYACGQVRFALVPSRSLGVLEITSATADEPSLAPAAPLSRSASTGKSAPLKGLICFDRLPPSLVFIEAVARSALVGFVIRVVLGLVWLLRGMPSHVATALFLLPLGALGLAASRRIAWHFACEEGGFRLLESWTSPAWSYVREVCSLDQVEAVVIEQTGDHPTEQEEHSTRVALRLRDRARPLYLTDTAVEHHRRVDLRGRAKRLAAMVGVPCVHARRPEPHGTRFWPTLAAMFLVLPVVTWPELAAGLLLDLVLLVGAVITVEVTSLVHRTDRPGAHVKFVMAGYFPFTLLVMPLILSLLDWYKAPVHPGAAYVFMLWAWFRGCRAGSDRLLAGRARQAGRLPPATVENGAPGSLTTGRPDERDGPDRDPRRDGDR
ncbi:MAG: hypothetical protein HY815_24065 [Candidatus Riflebacteria bacterium]|nr:hypothetical protein [Candidatus Riflebacteria bacterium]